MVQGIRISQYGCEHYTQLVDRKHFCKGLHIYSWHKLASCHNHYPWYILVYIQCSDCHDIQVCKSIRHCYKSRLLHKVTEHTGLQELVVEVL